MLGVGMGVILLPDLRVSRGGGGRGAVLGEGQGGREACQACQCGTVVWMYGRVEGRRRERGLGPVRAQCGKSRPMRIL